MIKRFTVYLIRSISTGRVYVGQTTNGIMLRFYEHVVDAYRGKESPLSKAILEYQPPDFRVDIIGIYETKSGALESEIRHIRLFDSTNPEKGYNQNHGGSGMLGLKHSEEWKTAQSERMTGANHPSFGKKRSKETCSRISVAKKGQVCYARRATIDLPYVVSHYQQGSTLRELGEMFGVDKGVIGRRLKEAGILLRRKR